MNNVERELYNVIGETEKYSGYDGYDEGDMSYFDGDDMSYFDGDDMSYADGGSTGAPVSDPYVLQYENTTTADVTAYLFGFNDVFGATNFGNPAAVVITSLQGGTYGRLMAQSQNKVFRIGKWRFQSSTTSQLQITVQIAHTDANGKSYTTPMNLSILKDAYQFQQDLIDITKDITIDGNTQLSFTLKGSATLTISMFPVAVFSEKAKINGGSSLNQARAPRLSGKNVAPVVIQTTQNVKGIQG